MVSPELIRRYPFFAGLDYHQIVMLVKIAQVIRERLRDKRIESLAYFSE